MIPFVNSSCLPCKVSPRVIGKYANITFFESELKKRG